MTKFQISISYGKYDHFSYKKNESVVELSWEAPDGLEPKYEKVFDDAVTSALQKLEKDLNSGVNEAKKWLAAQDKKIDDIIKEWNKEGVMSKKDLDFCKDIEKIVPDIIESLEAQRFNTFNSMLDKILDNAVSEMATKHKQKVTKAKVKKVLKIIGFAVLALAGTTAAVVATILTFGAAAGPIIGAVSLAIGGLSTGASVIVRAKGIWGSGKDEAKNLEGAAKEYAEAAARFNEVLARQVTYLGSKTAQLDVLEKQIRTSEKQLATLDGLKKNLGDKMQAKIEKAVKELDALDKARSDLEADLKQHEKLVAEANSKKTYEAAVSLAATLKADRGILDKISEGFGNVSGILGSVGGALS